MNPTRTIALFKNDIIATISDAQSKGKDSEEIDFRLRSVWGITLAQWTIYLSL
jgi:hypothetical protein